MKTSATQTKIKVQIVSDYDDESVEAWLKQQSVFGDRCYYQKDYKVIYTTRFIQADYILLINKVNQNTQVQASRIWGIQQEPFITGNLQYAIPYKNEFAKNPKTYAQCSKVFAFVKELLNQDAKFIPSPPYLYWLIEGGGIERWILKASKISNSIKPK